MDTFNTDKALFAACRADFPAIRVKLNREWNEYTINAPGHAVQHVDKAHCPTEQAMARGEAYQAAKRLAALCAPTWTPRAPLSPVVQRCIAQGGGVFEAIEGDSA